MKDYRYELLEFLYNQPTHSGNVLPLVNNYLSDINREERVLYNKFLAPLKEDKFITYTQDSHFALASRQGMQWFSDNVHVELTYKGAEEYERLRDKKFPKPEILPTYIVTHGANSPVTASGDITQTTTTNLNTEDKSISRATLRWTIIGVFVAIIVAIAMILLSHN